jgi:hypothetical protein
VTGTDEVGFQDVPPDPSIAEAVGRHHNLATALADLVDNSIDAGAEHIHIRFATDIEAIRQVLVIDDGRGMAPSQLDGAMKYGARRDYEDEDLGHFGLGLKAASLSQADEMDVYSRGSGGVAVGRRIRHDKPTRVFELQMSAAEDFLGRSVARIPGSSAASPGTVVRWSGLRSVLQGRDHQERAGWLSRTFEEIRQHLGLVFNRFIADGRIKLTLDEYDLGARVPGARRHVDAIDPVGYSAAAGGHTLLRIELGGGVASIAAHIWPHRQLGSARYRLYGQQGEAFQGFFVFRRDRLLQAGGWNNVVAEHKDLALARIVLDLEDEIAAHTVMNPEKAGVEFDAELRAAIQVATGIDGDSFSTYLENCRRAAQVSRERTKRPITVAEPGSGLSGHLAALIEQVADPVPGGKVDIRWRTSLDDQLIDVDIERRTTWLNSRHRSLITSGSDDQNDAPLLKTLILLLFSRFFEGARIGSREKQEIKVWNQLLKAALLAQQAEEADEDPM